MKNLKILWLVTARSGSKSIPDKNIKLLDGQPLLSYRIKSASQTSYPNSIWISTDSDKYAQIAKSFGAEVKFKRPNYLSKDNSSSVDVVLHAMNYAEINNYKFNFIGLLEPTSPFITTSQLDQALSKLANEEDARSIVAVIKHRPNTIFVQDESPYLDTLSKKLNRIKKMGRQEFKNQITPSGGFYIAKWDTFLEDKSFYTDKTLSFLVDEISGLEIDEPIDFSFAEFIVKNYDLNK
tara:strand:+ start:261 stop:971 length:711 start_codon:yes stop_codon:yes gene_type:complete